jgi:hypothetical protein
MERLRDIEKISERAVDLKDVSMSNKNDATERDCPCAPR